LTARDFLFLLAEEEMISAAERTAIKPTFSEP
jgi:hypothetical protein